MTAPLFFTCERRDKPHDLCTANWLAGRPPAAVCTCTPSLAADADRRGDYAAHGATRAAAAGNASRPPPLPLPPPPQLPLPQLPPWLCNSCGAGRDCPASASPPTAGDEFAHLGAGFHGRQYNSGSFNGGGVATQLMVNSTVNAVRLHFFYLPVKLFSPMPAPCTSSPVSSYHVRHWPARYRTLKADLTCGFCGQ